VYVQINKYNNNVKVGLPCIARASHINIHSCDVSPIKTPVTNTGDYYLTNPV
jgi:hypothetical protein